MNVPFPPVLLWPVVIAMVVGAVCWRRWQKRAILAAPPEDWPKHAPKGWKHFRGYPWLLLIIGVIGAYSLWRFSAPSLYGVVLDAATGQGIPNAPVARKVFRSAQVSLTESPGTFTELWSRVETRTNSRGRFRLPGYVSLLPLGIQGESGIAWKVFASGYMIAGGCEFKGFPAGDGCGAEAGFSLPDAWATSSVKRRFGRIRLEVRLRALPATDGNGWGEYFRRLNLLVQYRYVTIEEFVREGVTYAEKNTLTEGMVDPLSELASRMGTRPERMLIVRRIAEYCDSHPGSETCRHVGPRYVLEVIGRGIVHR
jgi:hypothetical protein